MKIKEVYSDMMVIQNVLLDWPNFWEKHTPRGANKASYSCSGLVDEQTANLISQQAQIVAAARFKNGEQNMSKFSWPMQRASEKQNNDGSFPYRDNPRTTSLWVFNATDSNNMPQVVDQNRQPIIDRGLIYSGCIVALGIRVGTYNTAGNIGVRCNLHAVMKTGDGEPLSNAVTPVDTEVLFADVQAQPVSTAPMPGGAPMPQQQPATPFGQPTQAPTQGMPSAPFTDPNKPPFL